MPGSRKTLRGGRKRSIMTVTERVVYVERSYTMETIIVFLLCMYFGYRLNKPRYEKKYHKKLHYWNVFNPKYWDKLH